MRNFDIFGVMIDCSRNAVMKPQTVKKFVDYLAKMGYNALQLYTEDTYEVEGEPYFGYLRGGYTGEEIREMDAYAKSKGVELIPCIQTLAHFDCLVQLPHYYDIVDVNNILLVDEPKTYELLDKMFASLAKNFTSRKVNIGMDEAHLLGLGKYLDKHGFENRFDILLRHLNRVYQIAEKYGFTCHMWSDMFFRLQNKDYYSDKAEISQEIIDKIPENMQLTYWDYYSDDKRIYDGMLAAHLKTGKEIWFAGGGWTWLGFAPFHRRAFRNTKIAFESLQNFPVKNFLLTLWGDDGGECSFFSALPILYATAQFAKGNFDEGEIAKGFETLFGFKYEDFQLLDLLNDTRRNKEEYEIENPCKSMLYSDPFLGLADRDYELAGGADFTHTQAIFQASKRAGEFSYLFETLARLSYAMEMKAELGLKTRRAYKAGEKQTLRTLVGDYDEAIARIRAFYEEYQKLWFYENKPFGWEVQDLRLGGLFQRMEFCKRRLLDYVDGKIDRIEELEQEILPYSDSLWHIYNAVVTTASLQMK